MLFQASQQALQKLASDPKHIGGTIGMIGILQTWTRDLRYHPHVHYLIPGGGMPAETRTWLPAKRKYLLPEKPLAKIFRAKFRDQLKKARLFHLVPSRTWRKDWVVDIIPVGSGEAALKYLALKNGQVTFRYRNSKNNATRTTTLPVLNFISRFLQHVLPRGFQKVRTYGLLHPKQHHLLHLVKEQLQQHRSATSKLSHQSHSAHCTSGLTRPLLCPKCAYPLIHIAEIPPKRGPP